MTRREAERSVFHSTDVHRPSLVLLITGIATFVVVLASLVWIVIGVRLMIRNLYYELPSAPPNEGITLQELDHEPWKFDGLTVTVSGELLEVVDPHTMVIGNRRLFSGEHVLVVSVEEPLGALAETPIGEDDVVQVTGTVERFDPVQVELDHGIVFEHPARLFAFEGEPVLIVEHVEVNPLVTREGQKYNPADSAGPDMGVTVQDVAYDPERYVGRIVHVSGEIEQRLSPEVFILSDHEVLVIGAEPLFDAAEEATAFVAGEVRIFDRVAIEEDLGIELNDELFLAFEGRPSIVAEDIDVVR